MKKILATMIMTLAITNANAEVNTPVASPIEEKRASFTWHPTAVAIGMIGGGIVGGLGAVLVGGVVGEVGARLIKKSQLNEAIEQKKVELETQMAEEKAK